MTCIPTVYGSPLPLFTDGSCLGEEVCYPLGHNEMVLCLLPCNRMLYWSFDCVEGGD